MAAVPPVRSLMCAMANGSGPPGAEITIDMTQTLHKTRKRNKGPAARKRRGPWVLHNMGIVEMAGIEPASNGAESGLLRVQFAVLFSAPAITRTSRRRAQSLLDFPLHPATGIKV